MPPLPTDQDLVKKFQATADAAIIGELFTRYTSRVYGVCRKYLKDREEARDAVMQLFEKLPSLLQQHTVDNFGSWLYVTARNHCLMQLRRKKTNFNTDFSDPVMENQFVLHPEDEPALEENLTGLERCIEQLVADQQQCVRLFYLEEKCYKEIETLTGFAFNQVKSFIQNGKRNLKICMEQYGRAL